jgi:hypothetical protein
VLAGLLYVLRLLKLGAHVVVSVRRMVLHLPALFSFLPAFRQVALALGASAAQKASPPTFSQAAYEKSCAQKPLLHP